MDFVAIRSDVGQGSEVRRELAAIDQKRVDLRPQGDNNLPAQPADAQHLVLDSILCRKEALLFRSSSIFSLSARLARSDSEEVELCVFCASCDSNVPSVVLPLVGSLWP